ncbi:MAG: DUF58 domain-containing protein [Longimicrobiaceae bacterium]
MPESPRGAGEILLPAPETPAAIDLRETLRQLRRLELRSRRLVDSRFSGEYHSVFKGQGLEFAEVREYVPGDDVRTIDWNVSARLGTPHVKRYTEEREMTVLLVADLSGSQHFGTRTRNKVERMIEVCAVLAFSAVRNNDRVGLLCFTDRVEAFLPPRQGRRHAMRLLRDLLVCRPAGRGTDPVPALELLPRVLASRSIVFLFSDFRLGQRRAGFERALAPLARRHDVVAVSTRDPADRVLPDAGLVRLRDPESGEIVAADTGSPATRRAFAEARAREEQWLEALFRRLGVDTIALRTETSPARDLLAFFRRREARAAR